MDKYVKILKDFVKSHKFEFTVLFIMFFLFFLFGRVNTVSAATFNEMMYIESTTGTEYVDTGIVPTINTEVEIKFKDSEPIIEYERIFGVDRQFGVMRSYGTSGKWKVECGGSYDASNRFGFSIPYEDVHIMKMGHNSIFVDGAETESYTGVPNTSKTMYIFHGNGTDQGSTIQLYYFKIWENGVLVRDFVPATDNNDVACLFDLITQEFYYNQGSGSLIATPYENSLLSLDVAISSTDISNGYPTLKTTNFPSEMLGLYKVKYRWNDNEWLDMSLTTNWQFSVTIGESGTYKFAYFDIDTDEMVEGSPVSTLTVTTVLSNIKYDALVPEPRLSASLVVDDEEGTITAWVETQEMQNYDSLDCYFITNSGDVTILDNITNWAKVEKTETYDGSIKKVVYKYAVYDTCRVYCVFHNPEKGDYGYSKLVFIDIDIDKMYQDYLAGIEVEDKGNPIIDFIVGIFVPDENFFSNIFSIVNEFFGETFGVLYYPIEVVFDFLNRFYQALTNDDGTAVINVPEMKFMDVVLISAFTFDFYSILEDDTFKMLHNIYLVMVDVILTIMLLMLAKNTFAEILGSRTIDSDIGRVVEDYDYRQAKSRKIPIGFKKGSD